MATDPVQRVLDLLDESDRARDRFDYQGAFDLAQDALEAMPADGKSMDPEEFDELQMVALLKREHSADKLGTKRQPK